MLVREFPPFVGRTAGYKTVCIRKVLRPTIQTSAFVAVFRLQAKLRLFFNIQALLTFLT
jgi:hypothetical protein